MTIKVLAYNTSGNMTYCAAKPENRGKGRCNHIIHKENNESIEDFYKRVNNSIKNKEILDKKAEIKNTDSAFYKDGKLNLKENKLDKKIKGMQHKGPVIIDGKLKFVKMDEINTDRGIGFESFYDYNYSSISEDICSSLIKSIKTRENFNSISYKFEQIQVFNETKTGTISENYLKNEYGNFYEQILSIEDKFLTPVDKVLVKHEDYIKEIIDERENSKILDSMIKFYVKHGVEKEEAKEFILNQAAFDLITNNTDRKNNSTNSVMITNTKNYKTTPINIDYGRCLNLEWNENIDKKLKSNDSEMLDWYIEDLDTTNGSIFKPSYSSEISSTVDFLLNNGFKPFEIDLKELNKRNNELLSKTKELDINLFVEAKIKLINTLLCNENLKKLWKEV